ncbi:MAG: SDR family NAD(P)-dependent oxidoreductase [bacterium]|nr:SDR family NAD(P)-dependent oxidoreductase [bacterium]
MTQRLLDLTAIITGGGRGIGAATARLFARHGARVMAVSRTESELQQTVNEIRDECGPDRAAYCIADVSDPGDVQRLFDETGQRFGPVDILVNNAGVAIVKPFDELTLDDWERTMAVNLRALFLCSQQAFRLMKDRGGCIIHISSLAGIRGTEKFAGMSAYVASKHGVIGLTESLSVEGRPHGIRVNCVAPGAVDTRMLREAAPHLKTETTPDDLAQTLLYLADPAQAAKITGAIVEVHSNA